MESTNIKIETKRWWEIPAWDENRRGLLEFLLSDLRERAGFDQFKPER
jgi:hypothetical protein